MFLVEGLGLTVLAKAAREEEIGEREIDRERDREEEHI